MTYTISTVLIGGLPATVQNTESREAVFAMPEEAGQVPAIFASTAVADDSGNASDCEILEVMKAPCMPAPFVL